MQRRDWTPWVVCARGCGAATASFLFGSRRSGTTSVASTPDRVAAADPRSDLVTEISAPRIATGPG